MDRPVSAEPTRFRVDEQSTLATDVQSGSATGKIDIEAQPMETIWEAPLTLEQISKWHDEGGDVDDHA